MRIKRNIDADIQHSLRKACIAFPLDKHGEIAISEYRMDTAAKAGFAYIQHRDTIPSGELPFLVVAAEWVFGVFHHDGNAVIIELGERAIEGSIVDFYENRNS